MPCAAKRAPFCSSVRSDRPAQALAVEHLAFGPHRWTVAMWYYGDVAVWDHLAPRHDAVSDPWPLARKTERLTLKGGPVT